MTVDDYKDYKDWRELSLEEVAIKVAMSNKNPLRILVSDEILKMLRFFIDDEGCLYLNEDSFLDHWGLDELLYVAKLLDKIDEGKLIVGEFDLEG